MFEGSRGPDLTDIPSAVAQPKRRSLPQLVWLVPIVAVLIGGWLAVKSSIRGGERIIRVALVTALLIMGVKLLNFF